MEEMEQDIVIKYKTDQLFNSYQYKLKHKLKIKLIINSNNKKK